MSATNNPTTGKQPQSGDGAWTELRDFPGYAIDRDGNVYSTKSNWRGYGLRALAVVQNSHGYASVRLTVSGRRRHIAVHRLVASCFLTERPSDADQIRHLDGDRMNPRSSNLAWGTALENAADRQTHGRTVRGPAHPNWQGRVHANVDPKKFLNRKYREHANG